MLSVGSDGKGIGANLAPIVRDTYKQSNLLELHKSKLLTDGDGRSKITSKEFSCSVDLMYLNS